MRRVQADIHTYMCIHSMHVCVCASMFQTGYDIIIHSYIHSCMHTCIHTFLHTCIPCMIRTSIHTHVCANIHTFMHTNTHKSTFVYTTNMLFQSCTYVCVQIHAYAHTHRQKLAYTYRMCTCALRDMYSATTLQPGHFPRKCHIQHLHTKTYINMGTYKDT